MCGKGRLGQLISAALPLHINSVYARIDSARGLIHNNQPLVGNIDTLILCFVPKHEEGKSGWQGLLAGLLAQVQRKELSIQHVLFISSTSVYEEVENGFVDAQTPVTGASVRSKGLIDAERIIPQLAPNTTIFRLTGLVGPGYHKYDPVTFSNDKPRQAVDTRAVAAEVAKWFAGEQRGHRIEVLTDGIVYWQGRKLDPAVHAKEIEQLSKAHRLLRPSIVCR
jgi:hypothetical protein